MKKKRIFMLTHSGVKYFCLVFLLFFSCGVQAQLALIKNVQGVGSVLLKGEKVAKPVSANLILHDQSSLYVKSGNVVVNFNSNAQLNLLKIGTDTQVNFSENQQCLKIKLLTGMIKGLFKKTNHCSVLIASIGDSEVEIKEGKFYLAYAPLVDEISILISKGELEVRNTKADNNKIWKIEPGQYFTFSLKNNLFDGPRNLNQQGQSKIDHLFDLKENEDQEFGIK
jgi:hypothetical protein